MKAQAECWEKLLDSQASAGWEQSIHINILRLLRIFVRLVVAVMPVADPTSLLELLKMAFSPMTKFAMATKFYPVVLRDEAVLEVPWLNFAYPALGHHHSQENFWVADVVNEFGNVGGFAALRARMGQADVTVQLLRSLIAPLFAFKGIWAEAALAEVQHIKADAKEMLFKLPLLELAPKDYEAMSDCLNMLQHAEDAETQTQAANYRLEAALKLLDAGTLNAQMNALVDINKLCEVASSAHRLPPSLTVAAMATWINENKVGRRGWGWGQHTRVLLRDEQAEEGTGRPRRVVPASFPPAPFFVVAVTHPPLSLCPFFFCPQTHTRFSSGACAAACTSRRTSSNCATWSSFSSRPTR